MIKFVFLAISFIFSQWAMAETVLIQGMHCNGCVKVMRAKICMNENLPWFDDCLVDLVDAKKEIGKVTLKMKPAIKLDQEKKKKLEEIVASTGRKIIEIK